MSGRPYGKHCPNSKVTLNCASFKDTNRLANYWMDHLSIIRFISSLPTWAREHGSATSTENSTASLRAIYIFGMGSVPPRNHPLPPLPFQCCEDPFTSLRSKFCHLIQNLQIPIDPIFQRKTLILLVKRYGRIYIHAITANSATALFYLASPLKTVRFIKFDELCGAQTSISLNQAFYCMVIIPKEFRLVAPCKVYNELSAMEKTNQSSIPHCGVLESDSRWLFVAGFPPAS